ncbi:ATP-binding protein [Edaphobacter sp.]|uniref:HAMP domain-containing sensor histidine kinase n=1 Tax=Edaphobacter sp. TaxID=1934404 RepID=UPI00345C5E51
MTRPVRALSQAFRRFSGGDLSVRLPVSPNRWSEIGGTDVRTLMLDFNYMADRVNELVDAQKLLIRDVSHELRSPLARLRMALEIARDDKDEILPSLDRMEAEADRVNELIGQMLTLSLMESTGHLTRLEEFSIDDMMETLLPDMKFEAAARGCTILYQKPSEIPLINGNPELFRRGVENVVRNAIRHTAPNTAVEIEVSYDTSLRVTNKLHNTTHLGGVRIQIRDRGPGVPEPSLPNLFRAFYRTDAARQDSTGGFGVGLSIAERSVELHGGSIRAFNRKGGGLMVDILVPFTGQLDLAFKET